VISFNGKQLDWAIWEEKFLARARRRGYKDLILGKTAIPADSAMIDTTNPAGKEQARIKKLNEVHSKSLFSQLIPVRGQVKQSSNLSKDARQPT